MKKVILTIIVLFVVIEGCSVINKNKFCLTLPEMRSTNNKLIEVISYVDSVMHKCNYFSDSSNIGIYVTQKDDSDYLFSFVSSLNSNYLLRTYGVNSKIKPVGFMTFKTRLFVILSENPIPFLVYTTEKKKFFVNNKNNDQMILDGETWFYYNYNGKDFNFLKVVGICKL
jgi:hypothetical protein